MGDLRKHHFGKKIRLCSASCCTLKEDPEKKTGADPHPRRRVCDDKASADDEDCGSLTKKALGKDHDCKCLIFRLRKKDDPDIPTWELVDNPKMGQDDKLKEDEEYHYDCFCVIQTE